eukprot:gene10059-8211_t
MVNIQFLMSGKQFIVNAEAGSATTPALATKLTQDQRIAAFFAQTSQAAAAAKTARKAAQRNALATVNVAFLQSGRAFVPPSFQDGSGRRGGFEHFGHGTEAEKAAVSSLEALPSYTSSGAKMSRHARLEAFYKATQANAIKMPSSAAATEKAAVSTLVNLSFLTSGKEFEALPSPPPSSYTSSGAKMSRHARLEAFYKATQANAIKMPSSAAATEEAAVSTLVNLSFLTSGKEFEALPPASASRFSDDASVIGGGGGAKMTRNARLEAFYKVTSAAAMLTPPTARRTATAQAVGAARAVMSPPPTMVNLSFLRSGKEFFAVAQRDRSVQKAKAAAALAQWKNPGPKVVPLIVNLQFLRSGKEFGVASTGSSSKRGSERGSGGGRGNALPHGPKKSRNARLEEFYARSAAASPRLAAATFAGGASNGPPDTSG